MKCIRNAGRNYEVRYYRFVAVYYEPSTQRWAHILPKIPTKICQLFLRFLRLLLVLIAAAPRGVCLTRFFLTALKLVADRLSETGVTMMLTVTRTERNSVSNSDVAEREANLLTIVHCCIVAILPQTTNNRHKLANTTTN